MAGTSVWYAMYGATLASESAFEDRMSALSRELGTRGRADAVLMQPETAHCASSGAAGDADAAASPHDALRAELQPLKPSVLKRRLLAAGAPSEDVHATDDADSPKAALIELIVQHERGAAAQAGLETELRAMKRSELRKKAAACGASAAQLEAVDDSDSPREAAVALILSLQ